MILQVTDDTCLIASNYNQNDLICQTNTELIKVVEWLRTNKLCLNVKKTKCIYFCLNNSRSIALPKVQLDGELIDFVDCHNFLGIHVDCYLKWDFHVRHVCNKISKTIGILYKLKYTVPPHILILLYNALILPYLMYGNIVWGSACKTRLVSIFKKQKQAIRICTLSHYLAHSSPIFHSLNLLNIFDIYKYLVGIFMYRYINNTLPLSFHDMFQLNSDIHSHFTRNSMKFRLPKPQNSLDIRSIRYTGPKILNEIENCISDATTLNVFKRKLNQHFVNSYNT